MSRVIQWNIKPPSGDNPDEQPEQSICPCCKTTFWKISNRKTYCDDCGRLTTFQRQSRMKDRRCVDCNAKITAKEAHRKRCANCLAIQNKILSRIIEDRKAAALAREEERDSDSFFDFETYKDFAKKEWDDFERFDQQVGIDTDGDFEAIMHEISLNGFAWSSSATHTGEVPPFAIALVKLEQAIEHAHVKDDDRRWVLHEARKFDVIHRDDGKKVIVPAKKTGLMPHQQAQRDAWILKRLRGVD